MGCEPSQLCRAEISASRSLSYTFDNTIMISPSVAQQEKESVWVVGRVWLRSACMHACGPTNRVSKTVSGRTRHDHE
jgi:hypothetical protein